MCLSHDTWDALMACLPWMFQTHSWVPRKNPIAAEIIIFGIIKGDFLFYIDYGMLYVLIRIASRTHNIPSC